MGPFIDQIVLFAGNFAPWEWAVDPSVAASYLTSTQIRHLDLEEREA